MITMKALLTVDEYNWLKDYLSAPWMKDVEYVQKLAFDENAQNFIRHAMGRSLQYSVRQERIRWYVNAV